MKKTLFLVGVLLLVGAGCNAQPIADAGTDTTSTAVQAQPIVPAAAAEGNGAKKESLLSFSAMVGVDGAFLNGEQIRGVKGDELPWEIKSAEGLLTTDGHLTLNVKGLVFPDEPTVPAELRGTNDESQFRALVSCLTTTDGKVTTSNLMTGPFSADRNGNSSIETDLKLPDYCYAPIIFVMAGTEDKWFAVTGVEHEEGVGAENVGGKESLLSSSTMVGVEGPFLNSDQIRGVKGDELPWELGSAETSLSTDGRLSLHVKGLVFPDDPSVPAELRGTNDEKQFRGMVSCLTSEGGKVVTKNNMTPPFPANKNGDSSIEANLKLPEYCDSPIVFVMAGSEDKWFAVTGAEQE